MKRYVVDIFTLVKEESITFVLEQLNSYHPNLEFIYESESEGTLLFLEGLVNRKSSKFETTVYRKKTNIDIHLNWFLHAPNIWKIGTINMFLKPGYKLCLTDYHYHLQQELC